MLNWKPPALNNWTPAPRRSRLYLNKPICPDELKAEIRAAYQQLQQPAVAVRSSRHHRRPARSQFRRAAGHYPQCAGRRRLVPGRVGLLGQPVETRAPSITAATTKSRSFRPPSRWSVQEMVQSQASGVLFTANPLNGVRSETVIDATLGLGEALVSGRWNRPFRGGHPQRQYPFQNLGRQGSGYPVRQRRRDEDLGQHRQGQPSHFRCARVGIGTPGKTS